MLQADAGIALDGDADRLIMADENGQNDRRRPTDGADRAKLDQSGRLKGGGMVATVMSNLGSNVIWKAKAQLHRTPVGDRYVVEADARQGLQCRRRAIWPYRAERL